MKSNRRARLTVGSVVGSICAMIDPQPGDTIDVVGSWNNTPPVPDGVLEIANP